MIIANCFEAWLFDNFSIIYSNILPSPLSHLNSNPKDILNNVTFCKNKDRNDRFCEGMIFRSHTRAQKGTYILRLGLLGSIIDLKRKRSKIFHRGGNIRSTSRAE